MRNRVIVITLAIATVCIAGFRVWQGIINVTAENYLSNGNQKAETKNFNEAIADYNQAIRLDPDYAHVYYYRGNANSETKWQAFCNNRESGKYMRS